MTVNMHFSKVYCSFGQHSSSLTFFPLKLLHCYDYALYTISIQQKDANIIDDNKAFISKHPNQAYPQRQMPSHNKTKHAKSPVDLRRCPFTRENLKQANKNPTLTADVNRFSPKSYFRSVGQGGTSYLIKICWPAHWEKNFFVFCRKNPNINEVPQKTRELQVVGIRAWIRAKKKQSLFQLEVEGRKYSCHSSPIFHPWWECLFRFGGEIRNEFKFIRFPVPSLLESYPATDFATRGGWVMKCASTEANRSNSGGGDDGDDGDEIGKNMLESAQQSELVFTKKRNKTKLGEV